MTARPLFGVPADCRVIEHQPAQVLIDRYMAAASLHADAAALIVPARPDLMTARETAARLDGLLLTGSPSNVEPRRYGQPDIAGNGPFDPDRDTMTLALIEEMIRLGRPVFGICRGFQEINVAFGGTLARDLGEPGRPIVHHAASHLPIADVFDHIHDVALAPGGLLARNLGRESLAVRSVHFQGVDRLGTDLAVEATAADGVIEAVSACVNGAPVLGVQWHPEWQIDTDAASQGFFAMFGRALRGDRLD